MTKRLLVSMDEERYEDLRRLAFEKKASMAGLVRHAIEAVFEDQLDAVAGQRGLEHYLKHPEDYVAVEQMLEGLGIDVPRRGAPRRRTRAAKAAS